jgi:Protein of unknown function (DUF1549)/Protein of unknown function (DUF1553)
MAHAILRGARPGRALALASILTLSGLLLMPTGQAAQKESAGGADAAAAVADGVKLIDEGIKTAWTENKITPSARCDDYEFIRRATLDIIGRIATPAEIKTFMDESAKDRRHKLIDRLLGSEEYAKNWANIWANWLLTRSGSFGRGQYHEETQVWLEEQFSLNKPFHETVKALITAEGKNTDNGAVNFILAHVGEASPRGEERENGQFNMVPITSRISRLFLGVQTQCCQCHDHPFDAKLKQNHFWGINAFLHQVRRDGTPPVPGNRMMSFTALTLKDDTTVNTDAQVYFETRNAKLLPAKAQFIDGSKIPTEELGGKRVPLQGKSRREELARLIVEHPNFGRAQVNRMWSHFFGKGFVNPIDDFNDQNQPSHPELLEELGKRYKHYGFNQKTLIRWICNSEAYNLSNVANKTNEKPESEQLFSRMLLKSMSPEELFESLMVATGSQSKEQKKELRGRWLDNLIGNFGDDEGNEVSFNGTVVQALMMMNGTDLNGAIAPAKDEGNVAKIAKEYRGNGKAVVRELYLLTLNRPPSAKELTRITEAMPLGKNMRDKDVLAPYQDLLWALLNSNEFMLNH